MDEQLPSLATILAQVPDPRSRHGRRHAWSALLLWVVSGLLSGANTQRAIARWAANAGPARLRRLGFAGRARPSQPTLHRLLARVDVAHLEQVLGVWLRQVRAAWNSGLNALEIRGGPQAAAEQPGSTVFGLAIVGVLLATNLVVFGRTRSSHAAETAT